MEVFFCNGCQTWITEQQLETKTTFRQTRLEPEETMDYCTNCGTTFEDIDSMDLDSELLCEILNEVKFKL
jgi:protein-arginine kinase activator protein McsA